MGLHPLKTRPRPPYPSRSVAGVRKWARRAGATLGAAMLVSAAGCYGVTPLHDDPEAPVADPPEVEPPDVEPPRPEAPRPGEVGPTFEPLPEAPPEPEEPPLPCEPEHRMSGMMAPPSYFSCDAEVIPSFEAPLHLGAGEMCGPLSAWASFDVREAYRGRVTILPGAENTVLTVIGPGGEIAAELGPGASCADLDLDTGTWTLRADPADPEIYPTGYFELSVDDLSSTE